MTAKRCSFEYKRKAHYNEFMAVKLARQLMDKDEDEEVSEQESDGESKVIKMAENEDAEDTVIDDSEVDVKDSNEGVGIAP